jgi:hypothetical protein
MNLMKKVANKTLKHNTLSPSSKLIMASMVSATQFFLNGFLSSFRQLISRNSEGYYDSYSVRLKLEARAVHCYPGKSGSIVEIYQPIFRQSSKVMISVISSFSVAICDPHSYLDKFSRLARNAQLYNNQ